MTIIQIKGYFTILILAVPDKGADRTPLSLPQRSVFCRLNEIVCPPTALVPFIQLDEAHDELAGIELPLTDEDLGVMDSFQPLVLPEALAPRDWLQRCPFAREYISSSLRQTFLSSFHLIEAR